MADYFPLIVNAVTGKIEELPAGDNLNLANSEIVNATIPLESLYIPGGNVGEVLTTDGTGNLSWGPGGGGNVVSIPPIYFTADGTGTGQAFTNPILLQYTSNTDITLFRNGVLVENTNYTLSGDTLIMTIAVTAGDSIEIIRQFASAANIGGTPAGANTDVQFNSNGVFGANSTFTWDDSLGALTAGNSVTANFFVGDGGFLSNIAGGANLANGTSNIVIGNSSNITFSVDGFANVVDFGIDQATFTGNIYTIGNAIIDGSLTVNAGNIALGTGAGATLQNAYSVAVGFSSGADSQGANSIAIGVNAGDFLQGDEAVAIGPSAGLSTQSPLSVAVGSLAGAYGQGAEAVAIGFQAGAGTLSNGSSQGTGAVAIGSRTGVINQGDYSVAIGHRAGLANQGDNSIVINAKGSNLNNTTANSLVIKPIREGNTASNLVLSYNSTSGEVTTVNTGLIPLNVTVVNTPSYTIQDSDQILSVQFNGNVTLTLPNPAPTGSTILVKDMVGAGGNRKLNPIFVTVADTSTQRIDGGISFTMNTNFAAYNFMAISVTQYIIY